MGGLRPNRLYTNEIFCGIDCDQTLPNLSGARLSTQTKNGSKNYKISRLISHNLSAFMYLCKKVKLLECQHVRQAVSLYEECAINSTNDMTSTVPLD